MLNIQINELRNLGEIEIILKRDGENSTNAQFLEFQL